MMSSVRSIYWWLPVLMLALLASQSLASDVTGSARELYGRCFGPLDMRTQTTNRITPIGEECLKPFRVAFRVHAKPDTNVSNGDYVQLFFQDDLNSKLKGTGPQVHYKIGSCSSSLNITRGHDSLGRQLQFTVPEIGSMEPIDVAFYAYRDRIVFYESADIGSFRCTPNTSGCTPFKDFDNREFTVEQRVAKNAEPCVFLFFKDEYYTVEWISADYIDKPTTAVPATTSSSTQKPTSTETAEPIAEPSEDEDSNTTPLPIKESEAGTLWIIIGAVSGLLFLLLIAVVIAVIVIRRRRKEPIAKPEGDDQRTLMNQATGVGSQIGSGLRM